jgi:hypothetical protein
MSVLATEDICREGNVDPTPVPFSQAVTEFGVYRAFPRHIPFDPKRAGVGLVVTTDAVLYVNDGFICDAAELDYPPDFPFYRTDLPLPDRLLKHRP